MKIVKPLLYFIFCNVFALSCNDGDYFLFEKTKDIKNFPLSISVDDPDTLDIDVIGVQGIKLYDENIIVSCVDSSGCISIFDKFGNLVSEPFLNIGKGPGELLFQPFMSWCHFDETQNGQLIMKLFDFKGQFISYNLTETVNSGNFSWEVEKDSLSLLNGSRYFYGGPDRLICRRSNMSDSGYERFIIGESNNERVNKQMEYLNKFSSSEKNLLSTIFLYNEQRGMVAELGGRQNVIHLYSLEDSDNISLALKGRSSISELERNSFNQTFKAYYDARGYDGFFAGLYLGSSLENLDAGLFAPSRIHVFDWDGNPLAEIALPIQALYFDIDIKNNKLYIVDYDTEKIIRYDISCLSAILSEQTD